MSLVALYTLGSVAVVSLVSLLGIITLSFSADRLRKTVFFLVSVSVGALFGDAFIHLIPEALEGATSPLAVSFSILAGILLFFVFEKFLHWRHSHGETEECVETEAIHDHKEIRPLGPMVLLSDALHNIVDGVIIAVGFMVSIEVGIATTIAIVLHEIPHEIADFGILLHSGMSKWRALFFNFLSAMTALVGALIALFFGTRIETFIPYALAFAAGSFIYIAGSDLVPELHKMRGPFQSIAQIVAILLGIVLMFGLIFFE